MHIINALVFSEMLFMHILQQNDTRLKDVDIIIWLQARHIFFFHYQAHGMFFYRELDAFIMENAEHYCAKLLVACLLVVLVHCWKGFNAIMVDQLVGRSALFRDCVNLKFQMMSYSLYMWHRICTHHRPPELTKSQ